MKGFQGIILIFLGGLAITFFLLYAVWSQLGGPVNSQGQPILFEIAEGESMKSVARRLEEEKIIKDQDFFLLLTVLGAIDRRLEAGEYQLSSADNLVEIIFKLSNEGSQPTEVLIIKEGETLKEIEESLSFLFSKEFSLEEIKIEDWQEEFSFFEDAPREVGLEGYLFPDTYFLSKSMTVENVIRKILWNFEQKITPLKEKIEEKGGLYRTVIMASLLEEEVITLEDKKIVAGIIEKRIQIGMPIQIDAAINYVLQKKSRLSIADTKIESPYNTYLNLGLPPGPISNPGLESFEAALAPEPSNYLYYLTTPEREVIFSQTLEEHNRAKAQYY
jgi:UPF0755 protein